MLFELMIENFALIKKLNVNFHQGLNVLTGETGAGKSIIIDAVNLAIGERADKSFIRTGEEKAIIQAIFYSNNPQLMKLLNENGIDAEDDLIIITRELFSSGRSISRINDKLVTVAFVKEISKFLIDIHGQHAHQSLLYPENHMDMLDSFQGDEVLNLRKNILLKFNELKEIDQKISSLIGNDGERERRKDILRFQVQEIDDAKLNVEEENKLLEQQALISNSEKIFKIMSDSYEKLFNGLSPYSPIIDGVGGIVGELLHIKNLDKQINNIYEVLQEALYGLQDSAREIRNYRDQIEFDPSELDFIESRLDLINRLKRKYGKTIFDILEYRNNIMKELEEIENSEEYIERLHNNKKELKKHYLSLSEELHQKRKTIAAYLENKMNSELLSLNMNNSRFSVKVEVNKDLSGNIIFSQKGIDKVEFLISTNAGEPLKPLAKIASGGEISRIMLGIKTILAKTDNIPTVIFDEIDTGISGRTAQIVGEKLSMISNTHQILCITHLPQIACMSDHHYYIEKFMENSNTFTNVKKLSDGERVMELGRLLGGINLTDLTLEHAKEMLSLAKDFKTTKKIG